MRNLISFFVLVAMCHVVSSASSQLTRIGKIGGKTFMAQTSNTAMSWTDAQRFCERQKLKLAKIESEQENNLVGNWHLKRVMSGGPSYAWLGGTVGGTRRSWSWTGNRGPVKYTNWQQNEPSKNNKCMALSANKQPRNNQPGGWLATYCTEPLGRAICS